MKTAFIDDDLRDVLSVAVVEGTHVRLARQIDCKEYERVNKVLVALGGRWDRRAKGHVFPTEAHASAVAEAAETGQYIDPKHNGYFPTPPSLARQLVEMAGIEPWDAVLEPSAGQGALADAVSEILKTVDELWCVELLEDNADVLRRKGYEVWWNDFLSIAPDDMPAFKRVAMNPPFQARAYVKHILHAWDFLAPGGVLAAIAPASLLTANDALTVRLRSLMSECGAAVVANPDDSFADAGTKVRTIRFAMTKGRAA